MLIPYRHGTLPAQVAAGIAARRPDLDDASELIPCGWDALVKLIDRFVDVGSTKFVVLPLNEPGTADAWVQELDMAARVLLPLQREVVFPTG